MRPCCFCGKTTTPEDRQHTNWPDVCKVCYEKRKTLPIMPIRPAQKDKKP